MRIVSHISTEVKIVVVAAAAAAVSFPHPQSLPKILVLNSYKYFLIHICVESFLLAGLSSSYVPVNIYFGNKRTHLTARSLCVIAISCFTCFLFFPNRKDCCYTVSSNVLFSHRYYQLVLLCSG